ncbi:MAG: hypothetical protein SFV51_12425, partial [Bryobacteraceae bacterium]|nr:hypothetical protein [Bryobacteraceae bacterium]
MTLTNRSRASLGRRFAVILFGATLGLLSMPLNAQVFANIPPLAFTKPFGGANPLPQILTVASVGASFSFTTTVTTSSGGDWLSVSNTNGNSCFSCPTPFAKTVTVNSAATLASGQYSGQIVFASGGATLTVPVTLTVGTVGGTFLGNLPGGLSFSFNTGAATSPSQSLEVRNGGAGTLAWTLSTSTADGGNWLTVTAASGNAPSTVTAALVRQNLPGAGLVAGTYIGQLRFQSSGSAVTVPVSVSVGDTVFKQINPISFTKPFTGANPLPQVLTVASAGPGFSFNTAVSTATGGDWLEYSNANGNSCFFCPTPFAITVSVDAAVTLAAGTYTGQVVFASGGLSMVVPVTLTVGAVGTGFFDNLPGHLSFSLKTAGTTPPVQIMQVRNAGSGAFLDWTLTPTTSEAANWLTVTPLNGSTPSQVQVGISVGNLPNGGLIAGTFVGQLLFRAAGSSVTVPVTVTVGDDVFQQINAIAFTKPHTGANPLPQILNVASTGANFSFNTTVSTASGGAWLSVSNTNGNSCFFCPTPFAKTVSVDAGVTLAPGTYTGQVVFASGGISMTVPVTLTVGAAGTSFFDNLPGQVSFSMKTAGTPPPNQVVQIRNGGSGSLDWTVTKKTSDGGDWLATSAVSGSAPSLLSVGVTVANLPFAGQIAGTFTGQLLLQTGGITITIPVTVTVGESVFSQVNPLSFTKPFSGANPLPQVLVIASTGAGFSFNTTASTATGGNWLSVSNTNGNSCFFCPTPFGVTVNVNAPPTLAAGTYTGQIVFASTGLSMTVPVTLTVGSPSEAFFDNLPGQLSYSLTPGGNVSAGRTAQIRNAGPGPLGWTATTSTADGGNWVNISASSGTAPADVMLSINKQALPNAGLIAGSFTGQVRFQTTGNAITIPISVTVDPDVFVQVPALNFSKPGGTNPLPQAFTVSSSAAQFSFSTAEFTGNGGDWLAVSNTNGNSCFFCATPFGKTATVNAAPTLPAGSYTGQIVFASGGMTMIVPVNLTAGATGGQPASIATVSGTPQSANVNTQFGSPLVALVRDAGNNPVNGAMVTFTAPASGASGTFAGNAITAVTNASGLATSAAFFANGTVGSYMVAASVAGVATPANFSLTNNSVVMPPGTPANPQPSDNSTIGATSTILTWSSVGATSYDVYFGTAANPPLVATVTSASYNPGSLTLNTTYFWKIVAKNAVGNTPGPIWRFTVATQQGLRFNPVTPCRVVDTRAGQGTSGAFGPPTPNGGVIREVPIPAGRCPGIP